MAVLRTAAQRLPPLETAFWKIDFREKFADGMRISLDKYPEICYNESIKMQ